MRRYSKRTLLTITFVSVWGSAVPVLYVLTGFESVVRFPPPDTSGPDFDLDCETLCRNSAATGAHRLYTRTANSAP
jgi:hypothetical protein